MMSNVLTVFSIISSRIIIQLSPPPLTWGSTTALYKCSLILTSMYIHYLQYSEKCMFIIMSYVLTHCFLKHFQQWEGIGMQFWQGKEKAQLQVTLMSKFENSSFTSILHNSVLHTRSWIILFDSVLDLNIYLDTIMFVAKGRANIGHLLLWPG